MANEPLENQTLINEARTRSANVYRKTIPAMTGGVYGVEAIAVYGQSFYILNSTGDVQIKTDTSGLRPYRARRGEHFTDSYRFNRVEIFNANAYPVILDIWIGFGEYLDHTTDEFEAPSKLFGSGFTVSAAGHVDTLTGVPTVNGQIRRKSVIVANLDPANELQILDEAGNVAGVVFAKTEIELATSGVVKIQNATGAPINYRLSELWYVTT